MFDPVDWLHSNQPALIAGLALRPRPQGRNLVLAASMGQAKVFYLDDQSGGQWMLKKFHPGRSPDFAYIEAVQRLVPHEPGFESGFQRRCLISASVAQAGYSSVEFTAWIDGTVLMPRVIASEWSTFLASISDGTCDLTLEMRLTIAEALCTKISALEKAGLAHRDLSATNVMVDESLAIHLIDWDSLYAQSLTIQANTTLGTNGYIAPFVTDATVTWRIGGDRFALAVLVLETFAVQKGCSFASDGSLLDQDDLRMRVGPTIQIALASAASQTGELSQLFADALAAGSPDDCPSPEEWTRALQRIRRRQLRTASPIAPTGFVQFDLGRLVQLDCSRFTTLQQ